MKIPRLSHLVPLLFIATLCPLISAEREFVPLFPEDGMPKGWVVRAWDDVRNPANGNPVWKVYKPAEWNKYQVTCKGSQIKVVLNGESILDVNLDEQSEKVKRHNGSDAPPLKDRPRKIGFQELSRGAEHAQIRNAKVKALN